MMQDPIMQTPSEAESRSVKPTVAPNSSRQVLKCPRCDSMNTKFCYYNNYSLTQPRHFCKNCRRYWTQGGALRNVPVGGGCRKNKRVKHRPFGIEPATLVPMIDPDGHFPAPASSFLHNATALIPTPGFADQHPSALCPPSQSHILSMAFSRLQDSLREQQQAIHFTGVRTQPPSSGLLPFINMQHPQQASNELFYAKLEPGSQLVYPGAEVAPPMHNSCHVGLASATATLGCMEEQLASFGGSNVESRLPNYDPHMFLQGRQLGLHLRSSTVLQEHSTAALNPDGKVEVSEEENWAAPHMPPGSCLYDCSTSAEPQSFNFWNQSDPWAEASTAPSTLL